MTTNYLIALPSPQKQNPYQKYNKDRGFQTFQTYLKIKVFCRIIYILDFISALIKIPFKIN